MAYKVKRESDLSKTIGEHPLLSVTSTYELDNSEPKLVHEALIDLLLCGRKIYQYYLIITVISFVHDSRNKY